MVSCHGRRISLVSDASSSVVAADGVRIRSAGWCTGGGLLGVDVARRRRRRRRHRRRRRSDDPTADAGADDGRTQVFAGEPLAPRCATGVRAQRGQQRRRPRRSTSRRRRSCRPAAPARTRCSATAPSTPEPMNSSEMTGRIDEMLVLIDRISTWFIEMLTMSAYGIRTLGVLALVLLHPVEHHDRVVQRVAEDRQEGDHRRRRDLELEHGVDADGEQHVVGHGGERGDRHPPLETDRDEDRHDDQEDDQRPRRPCR